MVFGLPNAQMNLRNLLRGTKNTKKGNARKENIQNTSLYFSKNDFTHVRGFFTTFYGTFIRSSWHFSLCNYGQNMSKTWHDLIRLDRAVVWC